MTSSLDLTVSEAKQLSSLSRENGIDKAIGKGTQPFTLWQQLLSAVRERYPFKEDLVFQFLQQVLHLLQSLLRVLWLLPVLQQEEEKYSSQGRYPEVQPCNCSSSCNQPCSSSNAHDRSCSYSSSCDEP